MYQEVQKMPKKKRIELAILLGILIWGVFLLVDYLRYDSGNPPIFAIKIVDDHYTDGEVREWVGLGYVYREYERVPIERVEFVPFWVLKENPEDRGELPVTHKDYEIPENKFKDYKYMGLLYFYNKSNRLIGTYKCINSTGACDRTKSGWDDYHLIAKDYLARDDEKFFKVENNRFVFVDDSKEQNVKYGEKGYERIVYLFDIRKNILIAKFKDIKSSKADSGNDYAIGVKDSYILRDWETGKWGITHLNMPLEDDLKTEIKLEEVLPYEYDSITYDLDTGYYIMSKDGKWFIYDLNAKKQVSIESVDPIYDVWENNNKSMYFKTGVTDDGGNTTFKIYKITGEEFFNETGVTVVMPRESYFMYLSTAKNKLIFMDYSKEVKYEIPLYFNSLKKDELTLPCFEIEKEKKIVITFKIHKSSELGHGYDSEYIDIRYW